jgi:carbon-monoxide dehydrogenase small subunit
VTVEGVLVNACCVLGVEINGKDVETIEGMAQSGQLHPLQETFLEETGMQCGICTPGFLMSSKVLLGQHPKPTDSQIRRWLAGNLCRCTGYDRIINAVQKAATKMDDLE